MIVFAISNEGRYYAISILQQPSSKDIDKIKWLIDGSIVDGTRVEGTFIGPRSEMISPWSTNAVEITQNMGIEGVSRIEEFIKVDTDTPSYDPMLQVVYKGLDQEVFTIHAVPQPVLFIDNIAEYNKKEGLALSADEVAYLESLSVKLNRKLTDSEVFGFSQVNSEHCRHKIFNGIFVIDGEEKKDSLFKLIKKTSQEHPNYIVSAYKDNVAFVEGPEAEQFAPKTQHQPDFFETKDIKTVLSLKAETHNFPTTVEPFNGAATGAGGEIRDRLAGGKASLPMAGTAVYMTSYPRLEGERSWEKSFPQRKWLYQTPLDILTKASNGASDFGNKFGQPLICGSVLTFEHQEGSNKYGFDKVIMLAGGIGYGKAQDSQKSIPNPGDKVVIMGGDNYRIGMGGSAVSSVATGEFSNSIELNAIQRSNPEMQKRVANAIRAMSESDSNPIISIHDHGAGGHLNCLSELVEATGGTIDLRSLPVGDPTLSAKEIVGNESQERMGLVIKESDIEMLSKVAERERAPMYVVGQTTGLGNFTFEDKQTGVNPIDVQVEDLFGNPPKLTITDKTVKNTYSTPSYSKDHLHQYIQDVLQLEAVACKDWLTNKVDRSVTGKVAKQQTAGPLQYPLNNLGAVALDYKNGKGIATSIGHAPVSALVDPKAGSILSVSEALTNLVWAPLSNGLKGVSLSANWMWPCKNEGEDARLYQAVEALSTFAIQLGINVPTGKDSLSMTQKYPDGTKVIAPGTVIVSAIGEVFDITKIIEPVVQVNEHSSLIYIDLSNVPFAIGGSSFAQVVNALGTSVPTVSSSQYFKQGFEAIQALIADEAILAGHDVSSGGLITTLLEMCFSQPNVGMNIDLSTFTETDIVSILFAENPAVVIQVIDANVALARCKMYGIDGINIGSVSQTRSIELTHGNDTYSFDIDSLRSYWYKTSHLLDANQTKKAQADARLKNSTSQPISYSIPTSFEGTFDALGLDQSRKTSTGARAAIIREKGVNGDREMAYSLWLAGFDVKDVHMTDLISGRETLEDVQMIVFVGGFSNSDVLGSAKGWAGAFLYNEKAKQALDRFYARKDTLSLGVCNGCQLMVELGLVYPNHVEKPKMLHNESGKFESIFLTVDIQPNNSVMLKDLAGSRLGIWVAHGEGKFSLPYDESSYGIGLKYTHSGYPGNPNGSKFDTAGIVSEDGRHLAMMPHLERAIFPWQCAYYPADRKKNEVTPWIQAFVNARKWVESTK